MRLKWKQWTKGSIKVSVHIESSNRKLRTNIGDNENENQDPMISADETGSSLVTKHSELFVVGCRGRFKLRGRLTHCALKRHLKPRKIVLQQGAGQ